MKSSKEELDRWRDEILSYGDGEMRVRQQSGLSLEELTELMLDMNVEKCPTCHNWDESFNLTDEDSEVDGFCSNCRKPNND